MSDTADASAVTPRARLIAPSLALVSCVRAMIARSTLAAPLERASDRLNRFPASPLCSVTWFIEGCVEMVDAVRVDDFPKAAKALFVGPQTGPTVTANPGPASAFMVLFYPEAIHAMTGIDVSTLVDRWLPLADALGPNWDTLSESILTAPDTAARVQRLEAFLLPLWQIGRANGAAAGATDWLRHLSARASDSHAGRGARSVERRIKLWAGLPMRTLRRLHRAEETFLIARAAQRTGTLSWSDVAHDGGYSDQAHQCREARAITGQAPGELVRQVEQSDESYWIYRIWY